MSIEAQAWAIARRVGDATRKLILWGLANHAHKDGRNAWAGVELLAEYAECSERTVQRHTVKLLDMGLIREGDQSVVPDWIPKHKRAIVYDLAMDEATVEAWRAERAAGMTGVREIAAAVGQAGGRSGAGSRWRRGDNLTPPESGEQRGDNLTPGRGDNVTPLNPALGGDTRGDNRGDTAMSPKPNPNLETKDLSQDLGRAARSADPDGQATGQQAPTSASPSGRSSTPKGHRLPEDWQPTAELVAEAAEDAPDVDQAREFRRFRDHWLGASGRTAIKTRWDTAYRNWMRRAQDDLDERRPRTSGQQQPPRRTAADERLAAGLDVVARLEAQERAEEERARAQVTAATVTAISNAETTDQEGALFAL
jgi:hypothetical protein